MNLALESAIRSGAVQNLFQTPCTLGVWNKLGGYMWITLEPLGEKIAVSRWDLNSIPTIESNINFTIHDDKSVIPSVEAFVIDPTETFKPKVVIPDGYVPIRYIARSVEGELNSYKSPMSKEQYEHFQHKAFNNERHVAYKKVWLWSIFAEHTNLRNELRERVHEAFVSGDFYELIYQAEEEMSIYTYMEEHVWEQWNILYSKLFLTELGACGEVVFASLFSPDLI